MLFFHPKLTVAWFGTGNGCSVRRYLVCVCVCACERIKKAETRTTGLWVRWATARRLAS